MFKPPRLHLSSFAGTIQRLTFFRNVPAQDPVTREERANFWPFAEYRVDVQPRDASRMLQTRITETYGQLYDLTFATVVDIRRGDRTYIDGAECIVEDAQHWGGHTAAFLGARQAGNF